ncbi:hypothetical protein ABE065_22265 [Priestia megaterium]
MKDKKHPQHVYEYDFEGEKETSRQLMDSYSSGVIGDAMASVVENPEAQSDNELYEKLDAYTVYRLRKAGLC